MDSLIIRGLNQKKERLEKERLLIDQEWDILMSNNEHHFDRITSIELMEKYNDIDHKILYLKHKIREIELKECD